MKVKELFQKHRKLFIAAIIGVMVVFGIFKFIASQPANVLSYISPKFEGYNGYGTVSYDSDQVSKKIKTIVLTKNGISQNDAEAIINDHVPSKFLTDIKEMNKLADAKKQLDSIKISFDKESSLSNGDTVKLTVDATKDLPIKGGTKTFKVSGLKQTKSYTLKDVIGNYKPTFSGIDGFGELKSNQNTKGRLSVAHDENLKNGDQVEVKLSSTYQNEQLNKGRVLSGPNHVNFKVTGLKPVSAVTDWEKLKSSVLSDAQAEHKSGDIFKYDLKPVATYVSVEDNYLSTVAIGGAYEKVPKSAKYISFVTVVKITQTAGSDAPKVMYQNYGYNSLPYYGGKLHAEDLDQFKYSKYFGSWQKTEKDAVSDFRYSHANAQELKL
ncbi:MULTISPECIES: hypothetical protein [Lacticaseibacillus]|uniref:Uncharacterized protein n=2 Tax=Lacticaseibacillus TaxID=2759736 RepID=A0AAN1EZE2_LACCA|nr:MULTISPECIES: hypothetical protein [Lacticaseibacillus]ARY91933.1 hypothetical protein BGL52_09285 [Lacticaseibacillus casei]KAB1970981.1 hypothetical protein F9B82_00370 [Lacticaseibacillus casei]WLV79837.1 hypothetical protein LACSTY_001869 [Lacticaseibacillus sp. NCIMB 15473]WNX23797.1 hypothetical protein RWA15_09055 [Lacticaseibacillus casei]WNX26572.1 hypothetical protein RWA16_09060 [Lacticaseibacillus casei]